jgi:hypothetical protein
LDIPGSSSSGDLYRFKKCRTSRKMTVNRASQEGNCTPRGCKDGKKRKMQTPSYAVDYINEDDDVTPESRIAERAEGCCGEAGCWCLSA